MSTLQTGHPYFRTALLLESVANVVGGIGMIAFPSTILSYMVRPSSPATTLSTDLVQWLGGVVLALTTPLLLAYPNSVGGVASRWTGYATLGMGEVFLISIMCWQLAKGQSAFKDEALMAGTAVLGATLGGRIFCMLYKPEWIGRLVGDAKKKQ